MKTLNYNQKVIIASVLFLIVFVVLPLCVAYSKGTLSNLNSIGY